MRASALSVGGGVAGSRRGVALRSATTPARWLCSPWVGSDRGFARSIRIDCQDGPRSDYFVVPSASDGQEVAIGRRGLCFAQDRTEFARFRVRMKGTRRRRRRRVSSSCNPSTSTAIDPLLSSLARVSMRSELRAGNATRCRSAARTRAVAPPMPEDAPVMMQRAFLGRSRAWAGHGSPSSAWEHSSTLREKVRGLVRGVLAGHLNRGRRGLR